MSQPIPADDADLLERPTFAHLVTLMPDGAPQVTPVWCDRDGDHVRVNSARGRLEDRNMRRDPRVARSLSDPDNPYRYLEIRGRVVETTEDGADAHIDALAGHYLGLESYPNRSPGEVRVIYRIAPERFSHMGRRPRAPGPPAVRRDQVRAASTRRAARSAAPGVRR